jgi:hypothetical protein
MVGQTSLSADCAEVASGKLSPGNNIVQTLSLRLQGEHDQPSDGDRRLDVNWLELPQMQKPEHLIESELQCCFSIRVDLARQ